MGLSMPEIIRKKRDKQELTSEEMRFFVEGVVSRTIDDSQTGAMLMAMYLNKLSTDETISLTKAMIASGETLSFPGIDARLLVDKHSTGGVGDKISLLLAPALAACGLKVPMISGRGLGYTGGTLDKLESIPGFQVEMNLDRMTACLENSGCFICGATNVLAPADSFLYKIRDITSTVEDPSLIAASILSKKAAEGIETLVMDVKFGRGCLYETAEDARRMAELLQRVGERVGLAVRVVLSEMNVPLGKFVGNSLEIVESVQCLRSEARNSVTELTKFLGGVALVSKGMARTVDEGERMIQDTFDNFTALSCFRKMLLSQGVSETCAEAICSGDYWKVLPAAPHTTRLRSPEGGVVVGIDALDIGKACWHLGAGRLTADSGIDHSVGVLLLKTVGDRVEKDEPWLEVHHLDVTLRPEVENLIQSSLKVAKRATNLNPKLKTILI